MSKKPEDQIPNNEENNTELVSEQVTDVDTVDKSESAIAENDTTNDPPVDLPKQVPSPDKKDDDLNKQEDTNPESTSRWNTISNWVTKHKLFTILTAIIIPLTILALDKTPNSSFIITPDPQNPFRIILDNTSSDMSASFEWNFGDGTKSVSRDPEDHIYLEPGEYTVSLDVYTDFIFVRNGLRDLAPYSQQITISAPTEEPTIMPTATSNAITLTPTQVDTATPTPECLDSYATVENINCNPEDISSNIVWNCDKKAIKIYPIGTINSFPTGIVAVGDTVIVYKIINTLDKKYPKWYVTEEKQYVIVSELLSTQICDSSLLFTNPFYDINEARGIIYIGLSRLDTTTSQLWLSHNTDWYKLSIISELEHIAINYTSNSIVYITESESNPGSFDLVRQNLKLTNINNIQGILSDPEIILSSTRLEAEGLKLVPDKINFSPDGFNILLTLEDQLNEQNIYQIPITPQNLVVHIQDRENLTTSIGGNASHADYSPDGKRFIFENVIDGQHQIYSGLITRNKSDDNSYHITKIPFPPGLCTTPTSPQFNSKIGSVLVICKQENGNQIIERDLEHGIFSIQIQDDIGNPIDILSGPEEGYFTVFTENGNSYLIYILGDKEVSNEANELTAISYTSSSWNLVQVFQSSVNASS